MKLRQVVMVTLFYPPAFSGAGYQAHWLARELMGLGVDVDVLTVSNPSDFAGAAGPLGTESHVHQLSSGSKLLGSKSLVFAIRAAWWLLRRNHWQILHLHAFSYWSLPMVAVALIKKRPIIVKATLLGADDIGSLRTQPLGRLLASAFRRVDAVVAISREIASVFESYEWPKDKILEIPNGVDAKLFCPPSTDEKARMRDLFGIPPEAFVILSVGAISRRKNMASIIGAAARTDGLNPLVIIAGPAETDPEHLRELERLAVDLEGELKVRFTGVLGQHELPALYKAADVFALLSFAEGLPNCVLEAMASGLPVIASDIPGCRDVVSRETGILVPPTEIQEVADAIGHVASNREVAIEMGSAARSAVLERYSIEAIARRYCELYESLIQS